MSRESLFSSFLTKYKDKKLVLTTHRHPDCDGTSGIFTLSKILPNSIIAFQNDPKDDLLPLVNKVGLEYKLLKDLKKEDYDGLVVLDCHTYVILNDAKGWDVKLIVDHHHDESKTIHGEFEIIEPHYSSTAELVFDLLSSQNIEIPKDAAFALSVGIIADTARFKAGNSKVFEKLSKLLAISDEDYLTMFKTAYPRESIKRRMAVLNGLQNLKVHEYKGYLIVTTQGDENNSSTAGILSDVADFVFCSSEHDNETRTSARASQHVEVPLNLVMGEVAKRLGGGGGGHAKASGASTNADINKTQETCLVVLKEYIDKLGQAALGDYE